MKGPVLILYAGWVVLSLAGLGCGDDPGPSLEAAQPADAAEVGPAVAPAELRSLPKPAWRYDPIGKRDPYRPYTTALFTAGTLPLTDLQRWEIDQLQLVGILRQNGARLAMLEDPTGRGHIVTAGDYIGRRWGRITSVDPSGLVITEVVKDEYGRELPLTQEIPLPGPSTKG